MNCSCSDNSFNNNSSADDDTTPIDNIDPEGEFYITQTIDGVQVNREVLLHLSIREPVYHLGGVWSEPVSSYFEGHDAVVAKVNHPSMFVDDE